MKNEKKISYKCLFSTAVVSYLFDGIIPNPCLPIATYTSQQYHHSASRTVFLADSFLSVLMPLPLVPWHHCSRKSSETAE